MDARLRLGDDGFDVGEIFEQREVWGGLKQVQGLTRGVCWLRSAFCIPPSVAVSGVRRFWFVTYHLGLTTPSSYRDSPCSRALHFVSRIRGEHMVAAESPYQPINFYLSCVVAASCAGLSRLS